MRVSDQHRFVYVSTPKAGTNSMYVWLTQHFGAYRPRDGGATFHTKNIPPRFMDYFKFTLVRNPYPRAVSLWWHCFQDPCEGHRFRRMYGELNLVNCLRWMLSERKDKTNALVWNQVRWLDFIIDRLDMWFDLDVFAANPTVPWCAEPPGLLKLNPAAGNRAPWEDYMTPEVVGLINEWAEADFQRFGYEMRVDGGT